MKASVLNIKGKDTGRTVELSKSIFAIKPNDHAIDALMKLELPSGVEVEIKV